MNKKVRVRFAPSPTGALHIGGVRTALYNYLFAKKHNGDFLLRIEDTDQTRFVKGAEEYIRESLEWLGIAPVESPWKEGNCGPYRQSERKAMYKEYAQKLIDEGNAYYAFDTPEELEAMRERLKVARVVNPQYSVITRLTMTNSLTLTQEEVKAKMDAGEPYVIRLKVPRKEEVRLNDMIRGWVKVLSSDIDDKILMKSDGMPTYHLANVVDDHLMGITHVIRGEEWLPSAPCHVLLYLFLGWESTMPEFAHLPLILKPDGNGKLSKRSADQLGFPIFPIDWTEPSTNEFSQGFKEKGYLPDALLNFLAFLGWNPGTEQEQFSLEELVDAFSIERITKAGIKFDVDKLKWFNQQYIKSKNNTELAVYVLDQVKTTGLACTEAQAEKVAELFKERVNFPTEFLEKAKFLFEAPQTYDEQVISKKWNTEIAQVIAELADAIAVSEFSGAQSKELLHQIAEQKGIGMGKVMQPLRVAITGEGNGPELVDIIDYLGKEEVVNRLKIAVNTLEKA
jgi:glutamyl-tRNA synthetase